MQREQTLIPVDMDQEEVALRFQKYALISAAVVDQGGRLVGMITVDDVVHIIQEEASEDTLLLSGAGTEGDINEPIGSTVRRRLTWLVVNLGTAILAASVVGLFQGEISRLVALAVLMPIVAGMGGNAGTQTMAVTVRALATNQLTSSNTRRMIFREFRIAAANGLTLGVLIGVGVGLIFGRADLGAVIALAMLINNLIAGLSGILDPGHARQARRRSGRLLGGVRDDDDRRDGLLLLPRPRHLVGAARLSVLIGNAGRIGIGGPCPSFTSARSRSAARSLETLRRRQEARIRGRRRADRHPLHARSAPTSWSAARSTGSSSTASPRGRPSSASTTRASDRRTIIRLDPELVTVRALAKRAHQGWRYLGRRRRAAGPRRRRGRRSRRSCRPIWPAN